MSEPSLGVEYLADCSVADFVVNSGSSIQGAVGELECELADFRVLAAVEFVVAAAEQAAFG